MKLPTDTRELVQRRAQHACEYCRLPQGASILPHQVDHIIGRQHRGSDDASNLCLCCIRCNLKKGPNIASIDLETNLIVPLFNPRQHAWREHFSAASDGSIHGVTAEGRATVQLLEMNDEDRIRLRVLLRRRGKAAAVLVSPEEFGRLSYEAHVIAAIEQGLADADAGRVVDDEDLDGVLAARIGDLAGSRGAARPQGSFRSKGWVALEPTGGRPSAREKA